jgi:preprotein translocase subunit SecE
MVFPTGTGRQLAVLLYVMAMAAIIVGVDLSFFRHRVWFWERLAVNVGVVLVFVAFYFRFFGRP